MSVFMYQNFEELQEELKAEYEKNLELYGYCCYSFRHTCQTCGKTFYCRRPEGRYCSYRCRNDWHIARRKERILQARQKKCSACGKGFQAKRKDTLYCCAGCKQKNYREALRITVEEKFPQRETVTHTEIKLRAERKAGELLAGMAKNPGAAATPLHAV